MITSNKKLKTRFTTPMLSVNERKAAGKALREKVPRDAHAQFPRLHNRMDSVSILENQAKTRLQKLVPIRYARMLESPFAYLRGSAAVMAADLSQTPVTGQMVQACGDMHVSNFGFFASAERNLVFGINDFDETLTGSWEWDLKRLVTSAVVATRNMGGDNVLCEQSARAAVRSYRRKMSEYAEMGNLEVWYSAIDEKGVLGALTMEAQALAKDIMSKAKLRGHRQVLGKMSELVDEQHHIIEDIPLIVRETHTSDGRPIGEALSQVFEAYFKSLPDDRKPLLGRYRVVDVARKVVGVGSVGTRCWVILMNGNGDDDPLFLQFKEAQPSVLAPYTKGSTWKCEGQRVVVGQRLIQGAPDIFLGWGIESGGTHFYMRQLRDMKGGVAFDPKRVRMFPEYSKICGWALALAHAKSGDAASISGYLGKSEEIDEAITRFAFAYAAQTEQDYDALAKAAKTMRIQVA
jgi:uncharacterized protein (DUF2252 family)